MRNVTPVVGRLFCTERKATGRARKAIGGEKPPSIYKYILHMCVHVFPPYAISASPRCCQGINHTRCCPPLQGWRKPDRTPKLCGKKLPMNPRFFKETQTVSAGVRQAIRSTPTRTHFLYRTKLRTRNHLPGSISDRVYTSFRALARQHKLQPMQLFVPDSHEVIYLSLWA